MTSPHPDESQKDMVGRSHTPDAVDLALDRRIELTQFRPGQVLTAENCAEVLALFDELEEAEQENADIYDKGVWAGVEEARGTTFASLLKKIVAIRSRLAVERAMSRFWKADNARLRAAILKATTNTGTNP